MKLSDYEFLPGVVINADDPEHLGRVKATVPTWFDTETMDEEALPWIYPFCMFGYQTFSKMEKKRKIWVFHNKENYLEYWYIPMFEMIGQTEEFVQKYDNPEVLISRAKGDSSKSVLIGYSDTEGFNIRIGDTIIKMGNDKELNITNGTNSFSVGSNNVKLGDREGKHYPTVIGPAVQNMFSNIAKSCHEIYTLAKAESWTASIAEPFEQIYKSVNKINQKVLSESVLVSSGNQGKKSKTSNSKNKK